MSYNSERIRFLPSCFRPSNPPANPFTTESTEFEGKPSGPKKMEPLHFLRPLFLFFQLRRPPSVHSVFSVVKGFLGPIFRPRISPPTSLPLPSRSESFVHIHANFSKTPVSF